uniref:SRR1 domain-containing protein n=1 Tax=Strongyloides stercoralis TaxID=6248 RepID=A0A0K0EBB2_STRER
MDADGFIIVTKKRSCKRENKVNNNHCFNSCIIELSFERTKENIYQAMNQLIEDKYINMFLNLLTKILNGNTLSKIGCFGIGHFGEYESNSTYQLALLLLIQKHYNIPVTIQEPILNEIEISYINNYPNCKYIAGVDLTKEEILESQNDYVLFFIPHGENEMYDGILKTHNTLTQRQKMIILEYYAIFAILAVQFTLQDDSTSSLEGSNESGLTEVQSPGQEKQVAAPRKTKFFDKLKSTGEKLKTKMKETKEKMDKKFNSVKEKAKEVSDNVRGKVLDTKAGRKALELKEKTEEKFKKFGKNLKNKISKVF